MANEKNKVVLEIEVAGAQQAQQSLGQVKAAVGGLSGAVAPASAGIESMGKASTVTMEQLVRTKNAVMLTGMSAATAVPVIGQLTGSLGMAADAASGMAATLGLGLTGGLLVGGVLMGVSMLTKYMQDQAKQTAETKKKQDELNKSLYTFEGIMARVQKRKSEEALWARLGTGTATPEELEMATTGLTNTAAKKEASGDILGAEELRRKRRLLFEQDETEKSRVYEEEKAKNQIDMAESVVAQQEEMRAAGLAAEQAKWAKEKAGLDEIAAGEKVAYELRQAEKMRVSEVWDDFDKTMIDAELERKKQLEADKLMLEGLTLDAQMAAFDTREQRALEVNNNIRASTQMLSQMTQQTIASGVSALVKGKKFEAAAAIEAIGDQLIQQSVADAFKATGMAILFNPGAAAMFALSAAELAAGTAMAAGGAAGSKGGAGAQSGSMGTDASRQYDQTTAAAQPSQQPIIINVSTLRPDLEAGRVIVDSIAEVRKRRGEYGVQY